MPDKRTLKRRESVFYLKVSDYVTDTEIGRLVDITEHGFKIVTDGPLPEGKEMVLTLELPEPYEGMSSLLFCAVSRYSKRDVNPDFYSVGFSFKELQEDAERVIVWLSNRFLFNG